MGDDIGPTIRPTNETPAAEHLTQTTVDRPAPSLDSAPCRSRSNSPAENDPESSNASLGALQVVSSSGTAHDETWNSFLDRSFAEGKASKAISISSEPSNLSRVSTQINTMLEAANGFVSSGVGLTPQDAQSIPSIPKQPPQPSINPFRSPRAGPSPRSRVHTYSFVFTSSRQSTNLRDKNVIGVVAAGGRASTNNVFPNTLPAPSSSTSKSAHGPAVLTPEQIRVHALGAKHAIPAHSPFVQLARNRSISTLVGLPLQSPFSPTDEDPLDRSPHKKGIDFYMDAARVAKTRPSKEPLCQPLTSSTQHTDPPFLSLNDPASPNARMAFPKCPPNTRHASLEVLPTTVAMPTPPASPSIGDASSKKRHYQSRTRERKLERRSFPNVRYTKYLENDPDRPSFISCSPDTRETSTSSHGSSSSGKLIASLDESITGMSAFGILGSGNAEFVFGSAVVKQPPQRLSSDGQRTPSSTASAE